MLKLTFVKLLTFSLFFSNIVAAADTTYSITSMFTSTYCRSCVTHTSSLDTAQSSSTRTILISENEPSPATVISFITVHDTETTTETETVTVSVPKSTTATLILFETTTVTETSTDVITSTEVESNTTLEEIVSTNIDIETEMATD